jgi:hypothetical protein
MTPTFLSRATDEELARFFDQATEPEHKLFADKLFELIDLKRRLEVIEDELLNKTTLLRCNECELAEIAQELASQQLQAA